MRAYAAVFSARFRALLQYRAAAIAGLVTQLFWRWIRVMIFTAFYRFSGDGQALSLAHTISYIWLTQAFLLLLPWDLDREIAEMIRNGNVVYELCKPLDLFWLWFSRAAAMRTAPVLLRCLPQLAIAGLFFGLQPPASLICLGQSLVSLAAAFLLSASITTILCTTLFWTVSGEGIVRMVPGIFMFFSGLYVPLPLFPDWIQPLLRWLPFRGILDTPIRIYLGHFDPGTAGWLILHQVGWTALFILFGRLLLSSAVRKTVAQGG